MSKHKHTPAARLHTLYRRLRGRLLCALLGFSNLVSRKSIRGNEDVIVSLTTYGPRYRTVHLTIESIARGSNAPKRILLWLDDDALINKPTPQLRRLERRGLEILFCDDLGPHKKYYPALEMALGENYARLITADDDVIYPHKWLRSLQNVAQAHPNDVVCHRARVVQVNANRFEPWSSWPLCETTAASFANFAIGEAGTSYPQSVLRQLVRRGDSFRKSAPRADDIWLHAAALEARAKTRQVSSRALFPIAIPGSRVITLGSSNIEGGENDIQIRAVYSQQNRRDLIESMSGKSDDGQI